MKKCSHSRLGRQASRLASRVRPRVEVLEDRLCPSTLTVTTLTDPASPAANDGSLRGELLQNVKDGGGDTIVFQAGLNGSINLLAANGALTNGGKSVTIDNTNGNSITINGQNAVEDLDLTGGAGVTVDINGQSSTGTGSLTITGGKTTTEGGGIFNSATTTLSNLAVSGNTATAATLVEGGGVFNNSLNNTFSFLFQFLFLENILAAVGL